MKANSAARLEPAPDDRQEGVQSIARDVAQPEAGEHGVDGPVRLGPRVATVEVGTEPVGDEPLARALERGRRGVVQRELALRGQERRPPAGAGGQLDDLAADRQAVEPAPGGVQLRVPGGVVDRAARVPPAAQVPVVVLGRPRLVVGEHLGIGVGGRSRRRPAGGPCRHGSTAGADPRAAAPRSVSASRSRKRRKPLSPALPTQVGQSCAHPSRSSGPRQACAFPHHRQSKVARYGIAPATARPASRSRAARPRRTPAGSKISASSSMPSITRGPGRLK